MNEFTNEQKKVGLSQLAGLKVPRKVVGLRARILTRLRRNLQCVCVCARARVCVYVCVCVCEERGPDC